MRVDQLAQERASTRLGLVVAALRDAANEEPADEFPSPPGAGGGGARAVPGCWRCSTSPGPVSSAPVSIGSDPVSTREAPWFLS